MNKSNMGKKIIIAGIALAAAILVAVVIAPFDRKEELVGLQKLRKIEQVDVAEVEDKIREQEAARREKEHMEEDAQIEQEVQDNRSPNEKMAYAVVMGDSRTVGMVDFQILDAAKVIAKTGVHLSQMEEEIELAAARNPQYVFLAYGLNDIEKLNGNTELFKEQYKNIIYKMKERVPQSTVYINAIQPVQQKVIDRKPILAKIPEFNQALQEVCKEENITYIDITGIMKEEYYAPDGIHFQPSYYPVWVEKMAEAANL